MSHNSFTAAPLIAARIADLLPKIGAEVSAAIGEVLRASDYGDIVSAKLGTVAGGNVDYTASAHELLAKVAPHANLGVINWAP